MLRLSRGTTIGLPRIAALTAAVLVGLGAGRLNAADLKLRFSDRPDDKNPQALLLRPTLQQPLFVYIQNTTGADVKDVTVEVLAGGAPVAASQPLTAAANGFTKADFSKPAPEPPAAPAAAPAAPAPKPAAPAPPALEEAKGKLVIHMIKDKTEIGDPIDLVVTPPTQYIKFVSGTFTPPATWSGRTKLSVVVRTNGTFPGPGGAVELVLNPKRIPLLTEGARKGGSRMGFLASPADANDKNELTLTADNLDISPAGQDRTGLVYLTIDGWERAYTLHTTFPASGIEGKVETFDNPLVRLIAPPFADPNAPYPVTLEADNIGNRLLELGVDRNGDGKFLEANNEIYDFSQYPLTGKPATTTGGDRKVHMLFSPAGPAGSLLLQPVVEDWKADLDLKGIDGPRELRVRLLSWNGEKFKEEKFFSAKPPEFGQPPRLGDPLGEESDKLLYTIQLNGSGPQDIQLSFPVKIKRGALLPVQAVSKDDPKEIKDVFFYVGKPGPDGKPPANVELATGVRHETDSGVVWAADLAPPTDTKGKVEVTAEFVKFNNIAKNGTATVILEEAAAPGTPGAVAAKPGSIAGMVVEGGLGQPNIEVRLLDGAGGVHDSVLTNGKGEFLFKDVPAGSYRVASRKTTDSTRGEAIVGVVDGKDVVGVIVNLLRQ
ncbi:MAG TPA: carboxypeptidase-like regulatory domain-containing protein [Gemmataceae bacterium]|nr:carboxypeptidase-like regulatory domain-containing protein [Gemmataceae bacterium]